SDTTDVSIHIDKVDRPPTLQVTNHAAVIGQLLAFTLQGADPDAGTTLTYSGQDLPDGMTVDPSTGAVRWIPGPGQQGDSLFPFPVSDAELVTPETVLTRAALSPAPPTVVITLTPSFPALPGHRVQIHVAAQGLADITGLQLTAGGQPITLDDHG